MAWKPKEKELTAEEAIDLAKKELAPFWFGSIPRIAGVTVDGGSLVVPLDPEFNKKAFLFFFINPTTFAGESALNYAAEWHRRYSELELGILIVLAPTYSFLKKPDTVKKFFEGTFQKYEANFTWVVDTEMALFLSFQALTPPKVLLQFQGKTIFELEGQEGLKKTEFLIQKFLRMTDPGLPLLPSFEISKGSFWDTQAIDFGPQPEIEMAEEESRYRLEGVWTQEKDCIATSDPKASVSFQHSAQRVSLIAATATLAKTPSRLVVEINGSPAYDAILGEHLAMDDTGESVIPIQHPQVYQALAHCPPRKKMQVLFRFPDAAQASISLYGLRFGQE